MSQLDQMLSQQAPPRLSTEGLGHELPPLNVDGIPTPIDKMTQVGVVLLFIYFFHEI